MSKKGGNLRGFKEESYGSQIENDLKVQQLTKRESGRVRRRRRRRLFLGLGVVM